MDSPTPSSQTDPVTTPSFRPKYPYIFIRTYLCGHPSEHIQVSLLSEKRLQHTVLPSIKRTHLLEPEYTIERCRKCATTDGATNLDISRNQGMTDRPRDQKRDGFMDVLNRYVCKKGEGKGEKSRKVVMHEAMNEDDPEEDDIYVAMANEGGRQHYERALRAIARNFKKIDESFMSDEILEDNQEEGTNDPLEADHSPLVTQPLSFLTSNTLFATPPLRKDDPDILFNKPRSKTFPLGPKVLEHCLSEPLPFTKRHYSQTVTSSLKLPSRSASPVETPFILGRSFTSSPEQNLELWKEALRLSVVSTGSAESDESKNSERSERSVGSDKGKLRKLFGKTRSRKLFRRE